METVLQESILALTFNHERSSIIYLAQPSYQGENPINELIELDLHNQTVLERYIISKQLPNQPPFMLITSKRKGYLILAFQPSLMEIWQLGNSAQGFNQSIWSGETKGRSGYEIQHADVSNLDGILFFSAIDQRNIYCANIDDTIQSNGSELILSKLRLPERVNVNNLKCHPTDYKICSACSDGLVRVWNQTTYTQLNSIQDEHNIIISLSFQQDGQKLLCGCDNGKILCYDAKTLGDRNILLAIYQLEQNHNNGILCLHWVNYNGAINCNQFLAYLYDGNIKLLNIKLLVPQDMIRDQKVSKSKKQELFGSIKEIQNLLVIKNDLKYNAQRQQPNIGLSKFIQIHPYANFVSLNSIKTLPDQTLQSQIFYQYKTQIILLNDNTNLLAEYPVCSQQYQYSFQELCPDDKNRILTQRYLYYIDQQTMEIKQYCLAKGMLKSIANLSQMILVENPIFYQLSIRPNSLNYAQKTQFLLSYKIETTYRCCTVMSNDGVLSDNLKEYPARFSMFLGQECWSNPPLFLLYEDRSSYSIIFEDTLPQEEDMLKLLNKQDKDKLQNQMKQSLNLKVQRMFWTPFRSGFVVIYQPMNENILKFSRNRNSDNNLLDLLMQSGSEMCFKFGSDEQITDLVWQKDQYIGAVVTIHNVYIVDDSLNTLKLISLQPQVNKKNRILLTYWMAQTLILQTKFHILYVLLNGICASIQSIDNYEEKNVLSALLWDRMILLCQSHSKKQNTIEIKTKWINILQPILQGYIHNKKFFNQDVDEITITKLLLTFANPNIDYTLIKDLEQFISCAKFIIQLDDCNQFTKHQKAKFFMNTLDHENLNETLFGNGGIVNNDDLQQQLIKKIKDRRFEYLKILLEQAKQFYLMTFQYRIAAEIDAILNKQPNFIIQILKRQKQIDNIDQYLTKEYTSNDEAIQLAHKVQNQGNMFFKDNIKQLIEFLTQQQQQIKNNQDMQNMLPSYYFTDYLLDKLQQIQNIKSLQCKVEFGKDKFNLIYEDIRNDEDEEESIVDNKVIRIFDRLTYDTIGFFLGVGGQPQSQQVNNMFDAKNNDEKQNQDQQYDFNDNSTKEFQELLIYWRIDEGKGNKIADYGNYNCVGDIYVNKEISSETEHLWEKLEESDPMDYQDLWGNVCNAQQGFELGPQAGIQTRKKNYWKKNKLSDFTIEMWIKPLQSSGQILQVDSNFILNINELNIEVIIDGQIVLFKIDENDEYNPMNQPQVKVDFWNHICLSYEQSASVLYLYIAAKYQFSCQELEISNELFKNKNLILGQTIQDSNVKYPIIKCMITEFRFWKQRFQIKEVRDGYRQPLPIVHEKQKEIKIDIKQESKPKPTTGLKAFQGLKLDFALEPIEEKPIKQVLQEDDGQNVQRIEQPNSDFGWFGGSQPNQQQNNNNFEFDSNFNAFAQAVVPQNQQGEWGSDFTEFANFDPKPTLKNDFSSFSNENPKPNKTQQQQEQKNKEEVKPQQQQQQKQKQEQPKVQQQQVPHQTDKQQQQQIPQKNTIQEIQQIVDQAVKQFGPKQIKEGVNNLTKAFYKLNEYLQGNKEKLQRIQKFIVHCAQYRFAFQLLIGINQMHEKGNSKKEIFMHLILIHQNIIPSHKLHWIIQSIFICIEYENTALAETLLNQLKQSLDKVKLTMEDDQLLKECEQKLSKIQDKKNSGLYKLTCPNCNSHFPFKGIKKCNKCNKDFLICQFKLLCISKADCLKCKACESVFSKESGQIGQKCPYCHIDVLNIPNA